MRSFFIARPVETSKSLKLLMLMGRQFGAPAFYSLSTRGPESWTENSAASSALSARNVWARPAGDHGLRATRREASQKPDLVLACLVRGNVIGSRGRRSLVPVPAASTAETGNDDGFSIMELASISALASVLAWVLASA